MKMDVIERALEKVIFTQKSERVVEIGCLGLDCSGCYNKIPQTGWIKQQAHLFPYHSGGWQSDI